MALIFYGGNPNLSFDPMTIDWKTYEAAGFHDEMIDAEGNPRPCAQALAEGLAGLDQDELAERQAAADLSIKEMGVSFTVYNDEEGSIDRSWPFDIVPSNSSLTSYSIYIK